jgi:hypothetical protein
MLCRMLKWRYVATDGMWLPLIDAPQIVPHLEAMLRQAQDWTDKTQKLLSQVP